jgi:hypothetical protein
MSRTLPFARETAAIHGDAYAAHRRQKGAFLPRVSVIR